MRQQSRRSGNGAGDRSVVTRDEPALDLAASARRISGALREGAERRGLPTPELLVEPGRWVVANAGLTLYRVGTVKRRGDRAVVAVDGGMSDNIRPALYGARHSVAFAGPSRAGSPVRATVVGKHCESGDVVAADVELPRVPERGDLLAVATTGAYCYSMSSSYNRIGRPAVVAVREGEVLPWLRRETDDDLDRLELDPVEAIE